MNEVAEKIAAEIRTRGPIPFAEFMRLALYCPIYGYYEREKDSLGREGDYFTNVSVGALFGQLLAFQFASWLPEGESVRIVEAGAHRGQLAHDILSWMRARRPELFERLDFCIMEPSARREHWQRSTLEQFGGKVSWVPNLRRLAEGAAAGSQSDKNRYQIIFSNELLDAMPVHRLGWDARAQAWFEWGVTLKGNTFDWCQLPASEVLLALVPKSPDYSGDSGSGATLEFSPEAIDWWRDAAQALGRGKLMTIDYGYEQEEVFRSERKHDTLRGYQRHRLSQDPLAAPGEQDLTAHVNFTALLSAGESQGLHTESFISQSRFLNRVGIGLMHDGEPWTPAMTRQFQTLTHPEHLGQPFQVLVQTAEPD